MVKLTLPNLFTTMEFHLSNMECVVWYVPQGFLSHKANNNQTTQKNCLTCLYVSHYVQQLRKYTCSYGLQFTLLYTILKCQAHL